MVRIAVIEREKCKPKDCGYLCIRFCPLIRNKIEVIKISEGDKKPIIDEKLCIGCGICIKKCPFGAIHIINLPDEIEEKKIFQYSANSFRLYGLPSPLENSVIGIIGRNGIGKSTSLKILSGILKPNFGNYDKEVSVEEIIKKFRGSELFNYFSKLYNKEIKVSYKPQDLLLFKSRYAERKVIELLRIFNNKKLEEYINKFGLKNILDRKIKELSGGELQKILIVASLLKEHNVLFLDEPSAFLDIKERIRFAKIINEEKKGKMVVLIEHDIAILDYLSDYVYIVYGKPKVFGVFSNRKSVRNGINEYLKGYLRNENVRIRDKSIIFEEKKPEREKFESYILEWKNIRKSYNGFKLEAKSGNIGKGEIVGIVGPNGIGKTTFLKIIAKKEKAEGEIIGNVKISYKPQYIYPLDITVKEFLDKINKEFYEDEKLKKIYKLFEIDNLIDRNMKSLSGGELQIVYIFGCLIKEADLYVLDEPSAFLDVEQRILLAKVLREFIKENKKSGMIVDHDILFIDYISDSLIVFKGEPGKYGEAIGPLSMKDGMNLFLKELDITFRRDPETKRPRINKPGSYLDRKQKAEGAFYYM